jgi:hypothetical protein
LSLKLGCAEKGFESSTPVSAVATSVADAPLSSGISNQPGLNASPEAV